MATKLNFSICSKNSCKKFEFNELTGVYDAVTNTTGWGTPNARNTDATAAELQVFKPGNATSTPDYTFNLLTNIPAWPTTDSMQTFTITNTDLGYPAKVADGIWKFVYIVIVDGVTYKQTITLATYCNIKCCVDNLFADIDDFECDCQQAQIDKALTAQAIYKAMEAAANCGNVTRFNKLKSMLQNMCTNTHCCGS